jgi:hypothetical protein
MNKVSFPAWTIPIALLVACLLGFGILIPWLGFFWDDWPTIWFLHTFGSSSFASVFAVDRPQLGWLFQITTALMGESVIGWQLFGVLTRWLCCLALWWALLALWPDHPRPVAWTVFLFAFYPGFQQQAIAVTYAHDWLILGLFFVSLGVMIWAVRRPGWFWPLMLASWLLSAYVLFADEYYFGLELLRPVMLWLALRSSLPDRRVRLLRTFLLWLPYLAIVLLFLVWRLILFVSPRGEVALFDQIANAPLRTLAELARTIGADVLQSSLLAWGRIFNFPEMTGLGNATTALYLGVTTVTTFLAFIYFWKLRTTADKAPSSLQDGRKWAIEPILIGILALFIAGIPFWSTSLPIDLHFPWDRFTLPMTLGASLLIVGLIELIRGPRLVQVAILAGLIGLAAGFHLYNGTLYRREWASQKALFWQLAWRAPGLQPGTAVMTADLPFTYFSDNSLTAPLNWIYAPGDRSLEIPYLFYNVESRQDKKLTDFTPGLPIQIPYRMANFSGSTSQAVALFYEPPGCVRIVDPRSDSALPQKPRYFSEILPLSDPGRILPDAIPAARPPEHIFGPEPEHGWCYYYERADLASQVGDWQGVVDLAEQAFSLDTRLYEVNAPELLPYIEGYAHVQQWDAALEKSLTAYRLTPRMQRMLCATWRRIDAEVARSVPDAPAKQAALDQIHDKLGCEFP